MSQPVFRQMLNQNRPLDSRNHARKMDKMHSPGRNFAIKGDTGRIRIDSQDRYAVLVGAPGI